MDVYCPKCGEPWEIDSTYAKVSAAFRRDGCSALGARCNDIVLPQAQFAAMAYDIMGDDMDAASSMMDDAEYFGLF